LIKYLLGFWVIVVIAYVAFGRIRARSGPTSAPLDVPRRLVASYNPVLASLHEVHASGESAMSTFTASEVHLWEDEQAGRTIPDGHSYDERHETGAQDLRRWLIQVGPDIERLMGHKAVLGMRYEVARAPMTPVEPFVREDYRDLWQAGRRHLDWLDALVAKVNESVEEVQCRS
jgi:hypothetical protein